MTRKFHPSSMPVLSRLQLRHALFLVWPNTLFVSSRTLHPFPLQSVNSHKKMPNGCGAQKSNMHAFVCLKARMATPEVMKCFNPLLETNLIVDASPVGLGAILTQVTADGGMNIAAYASRSLTKGESRYSQTEREAPSTVIWEIEYFHLYHYRSSIRVITDYKPFEIIFNNPTCKATARLKRLQLPLQPYKTTVEARNRQPSRLHESSS